ncbi:MAG: type IV secretory system conjugative DNA transfer family protein, partial [Lachnospiraceae bacterium]|nr:type IV secretory system conjugative DNA transfer family protein [Lachnospiraceae bacterium]
MSEQVKAESLILAEGQYYSMDCYETQLNNNVLIVGAAGSGKTRSIVSPNILQATGSYVITDPKGQLHKKYGAYLEKRGYTVKVLDLIHPNDSACYNPFHYIKSTKDVIKMAHMFMDCSMQQECVRVDPFWEEADEMFLSALIGYLHLHRPKHEQILKNIYKLMYACEIQENYSEATNALDRIFRELEKKDKDDFAAAQYKKFRQGAGKTLCSILISLSARLGKYDYPEFHKMTESDNIDLGNIGKEKTAVFVIISDKDRSMDGFANIFYSQAMDELCRVADDECEDGRLPIPVRFILDDFATNCKITDFPRMISSIRSRGISTMMILQCEAQLQNCYGPDGRTIIANCDSYVYLGGNDLETAEAISKRCDVPLGKILYMPIGTNWIFRRGQRPVNGKNF